MPQLIGGVTAGTAPAVCPWPAARYRLAGRRSLHRGRRLALLPRPGPASGRGPACGPAPASRRGPASRPVPGTCLRPDRSARGYSNGRVRDCRCGRQSARGCRRAGDCRCAGDSACRDRRRPARQRPCGPQWPRWRRWLCLLCRRRLPRRPAAGGKRPWPASPRRQLSSSRSSPSSLRPVSHRPGRMSPAARRPASRCGRGSRVRT